MSSNTLKINDEYVGLVPPLTQIEYNILKNSIKKSNGNIIPITVNRNRIILDGHHRYRAIQELCLTPKIEVQEFSDDNEEKEIIIDLNLRVAELKFGNELAWFYDLTNKDWEFILLTSNGWKIVNNLQ